jgi:hypothetical protein
MHPTLRIQPFESAHLDAAVRLFTSSYQGLRHAVPLMPAQYEDPRVVRPLLAALAEQPMVAAVADGQVVGYLGGLQIPEFKGRATASTAPSGDTPSRPKPRPTNGNGSTARCMRPSAEPGSAAPY